MTTMNVSLPDELKIFVDERVAHDGYGSTSEYVRDLIRRDRERGHLRGLVLEGANSGAGVVADTAYFDVPDLRVTSVGKFPYLLFYLEREASVDVWRLLHTSRDIPASLPEPDA